MVFRGGIFGGRCYNHSNPYLNSTIILFVTINGEPPKVCHVPQLYQLSSEKWSTHYALLSTIFSPLHSSTNQELFKFVIKIATLRVKYRWYLQKKPSHATTKLTLLLSAKMNEAQNRTTVSPWRMYCAYRCTCQMVPLRLKCKLVALAVIEIVLAEGIQLLSQ